jgi:hypothetical protein
LCAYWPVKKVARDGQQSGKLTIAWSKRPLARDQRARLRHRAYRAEVLVVGHHDDHLRAVGRPLGHRRRRDGEQGASHASV